MGPVSFYAPGAEYPEAGGMVRDMWYDPQLRAFGCRGRSKCSKKCLFGEGSADKNNPSCGAFKPPALRTSPAEQVVGYPHL